MPRRCPFRDCDFEGTDEEVADHVAYMTSVVCDREHDEENRR